MATAKRRINSTNRKRIGQEAVDIRMLETSPGSSPRATAKLDLTGLGFPASAGVAIEAYRSSSLMRFDCGTVGDLHVPELMVLDEIEAGGNVQFRVKVVDREEMTGRLLGSAQRIQPRSKEDGEGRRSLLPIRYDDLGAEIWSVAGADDEPPALVLNYRATGIESRIFTDPLVRGLLMPAAFRMVLERLVSMSPPEEDDENDWKKDWIRFCEEELNVPGSPFEGDADDKSKWIDDAAMTFARRAGFLDKIRAASEGEK